MIQEIGQIDCARFLNKVDFSGAGGCWIWKAGKSQKGYGSFWLNGKTESAHRISHLLFKGQIPDGRLACHKCDVPSCVNPDHLFMGTHADNQNDMAAKQRGPHGDKHWKATISIATATRIKELLRAGMKQLDISTLLGVNYGTVKNIRNGTSFRYLVIQPGNWICPAPAKRSGLSQTEQRQKLYAQGLTARGTPRKQNLRTPAFIIEAAKREGVGVTAIYSRLKRGTMKAPEALP